MITVGQTHSVSPKACLLFFVGGPADGLSGLFDHDRFDGIGFSDQEEKTTYTYAPSGRPRIYELKYICKWSKA